MNTFMLINGHDKGVENTNSYEYTLENPNAFFHNGVIYTTNLSPGEGSWTIQLRVGLQSTYLKNDFRDNCSLKT